MFHGAGRVCVEGEKPAENNAHTINPVYGIYGVIAAKKGQVMTETVVTLRLNQQQLELMDRTIAQGVAADRVALVRLALRAAAAGGLLVLGVIAIFSFGLPLVIAGAMASGATVRTLRGPFVNPGSLAAVAAAAIAVALLVAGFEVTERMIVCPSQGTASGSGQGFVSGPYHYECVNGRLSFHSGS